ncbi:hypothetical protein V8F06_007788 [Rhypophila decipiens]
MKFAQIAALLSFSGLIAGAPQPGTAISGDLLEDLANLIDEYNPAAPIAERAVAGEPQLQRRRCCSKGEFAACIFSGAINPMCRNVPDCPYTRNCLQICGGVTC